MPALTNIWTRDFQLADIPQPQSVALGPHLITHKLLLISCPTEGKRKSWPEHTVGWQLAQDCLQMTAARIKPQPESYESTPTTRHLRLHRHIGANNLPKAVT